ncbi:MAG: Fic family protein [bacterium]|nr:Fic family protein [bacterium]
MSTDPYVDPRTGVLRNRLGITDQATLNGAEREITSRTVARLQVRPLPGAYDLPHLQAFHREIFGAIYPWAGELRGVAIAKGELFCLPQHIPAAGAELFRDLAHEHHLRGLERDPFLDRLTHYLGEINALHPFREGNGRAQRAFAGQLARQAGYVLRWDGLDPGQNVHASQASMRGDPAPMRALLTPRVEPMRIGGGVDRAPGPEPSSNRPVHARILPTRRTRAPSLGPERD